ncbi:hypothetical protein FNF29_03427 [Cafeteria roenbergensis]|uniref:riboflavin kinase n=1 Tax=Cafeteria roenbergensis TaxID=33653 RepID=A0A5A8CIL6_CAFRO|nr:hypothetical protein FNF29_03427 [Cafeteria roenbergensis]|eukprot:KAA0152903.1 hypothetical protein FNF29_03427 [Cafeteria roenbergensis]
MASTTPAAAPANGGPIVEDYSGLRVLDEPFRVSGEVVKGFGRGSKELGIPTANLPIESLGAAVDSLESGVYFGWAALSGKGPFKMVMSVGWNPYYKNSKKTIEPHLLHTFEEDFYGEDLRLVVTGYMRPEKDYAGLDELIAAIRGDVTFAWESLDKAPHAALAADPFLSAAASATTAPASATTAPASATTAPASAEAPRPRPLMRDA